MDAKMDTVFYDETPAYEGEDCEIILNGDEIVVSYDDEDGVTVYRGKDDGQGHFVIECREKRGKATLHRMKRSKFLEGFWIEAGYKRFWRIVLP